MSFPKQLKVQTIKGSENRQLLANFVYITKQNEYIIVPQGFITDYASIPKVIPKWILDADSPKIREIAVIHDYFYSKKGIGQSFDFPRKYCDLILFNIISGYEGVGSKLDN